VTTNESTDEVIAPETESEILLPTPLHSFHNIPHTYNNNNNNNKGAASSQAGPRTANITGDARESTFLFQQLSVALQTGNTVSFQNTFTAS